MVYNCENFSLKTDGYKCAELFRKTKNENEEQIQDSIANVSGNILTQFTLWSSKIGMLQKAQENSLTSHFLAYAFYTHFYCYCKFELLAQSSSILRVAAVFSDTI